MSLINQVLQDLDARQQENGAQTVLPDDVRPLPAPRKSRRPVLLLVVLLIALVLGGVYGEWEKWLPGQVPDAPARRVGAPAPVLPSAAPQSMAVSQPAVQELPVQKPTVEPAELKKEDVGTTGAIEQPLRMSDGIALSLEKKSEKKLATKPITVKNVAPTPAEPKAASKPEASGAGSVAGGRVGSGAVQGEPAVRPSLSPAPTKGLGKRDAMASIERTEVHGAPRERAEAEYRKAIAALNQGRETEALEGLRNALRQDVLHAASRQLLVKLLLESKRREEAMALLQEGLQELPAQIGWAMSLARLQVDRGDLAGAWKTLDHSLPAAGNSADYQGFSGHVLQRLGRGREAAERYAQAARLSPGDGRWWLGLGLANESEGRVTEAREAFLRARQCGNLSPELANMVEHRLR